MEYEPVIGLEVHVQLNTKSKIFCKCSTSFGSEPNKNTCPVCLGMPGVLPVLNKEVVDKAIKVGLATNCAISPKTKFDRKNYFYPDLPKGYQISQFDMPICKKGRIDILLKNKLKSIGLTRIHMEEDAGKLLHGDNLGDSHSSYVDLNRTGVPLIEIVSEPDIRSAAEAKIYLEKLKTILEYVEVSDCNMEEGSIRCDANVSIRPVGQKEFGTRTELKNMNSFRFVQKGIEHEIERQTQVLKDGGMVIQETRLYDSNRDITFPMRSKEEAHDYRYFPEPDLEPVLVDKSWIKRISESLPELPDAKKDRFMTNYGLPEYDASVITSSRSLAHYFEEAAKGVKSPKTVSNWVMGEVMRVLKEDNIEPDQLVVKPVMLRQMLELVESEVISGKIAKTVFEEMIKTGDDPETIVDKKGLVQITDISTIEEEVKKVIEANPKQLKQYKEGKTKLLGFFIGQVMKATNGKANPEVVNKILKAILG
ncbi:MAG TPA: Asp-tRNA(Asn)/Glu-tRNA(Gln) amidotransferase subunit GatB [Nitrospinota bacterium]|nr:Asp-tRNA(Asn)/Glu-tRNA(Gln) amidotransferase subunit GatB [Nitrospinota bacterium]|tara:strand:+ start:113697 stop:115133 length:1437 start_codon:yes stop_codon:yes gene_type:complete